MCVWGGEGEARGWGCCTAFLWEAQTSRPRRRFWVIRSRQPGTVLPLVCTALSVSGLSPMCGAFTSCCHHHDPDRGKGGSTCSYPRGPERLLPLAGQRGRYRKSPLRGLRALRRQGVLSGAKQAPAGLLPLLLLCPRSALWCGFPHGCLQLRVSSVSTFIKACRAGECLSGSLLWGWGLEGTSYPHIPMELALSL